MPPLVPTADSAETIGRVLVAGLELLLGALAIYLGRRRGGVWGALLTGVGVLLLLLFVLALFAS